MKISEILNSIIIPFCYVVFSLAFILVPVSCKYLFSNVENCIQPSRVCPNSNVTFWIYTRETFENPDRIYVNNSTPLFNVSYFYDTLKILIHGYSVDKDYDDIKNIRAALFKRSNCSVISVDYAPLARYPCYLSAVINSDLVANCTAKMIDYLVTNAFVPLQSIHIIGHSLGAQISGKISHYLKSGRLERITGLDPAWPLFMTSNPNKKLDINDANFVDVIHTNVLVQGQLEQTGHVDFYVEDGSHQPGCIQDNFYERQSCNHARAVKLYAESINSEVGFIAKECANWILHVIGYCRFLTNNSSIAIMGEYVSKKSRGNYFLKTADSSPYALGVYGID